MKDRVCLQLEILSIHYQGVVSNAWYSWSIIKLVDHMKRNKCYQTRIFVLEQKWSSISTIIDYVRDPPSQRLSLSAT